MSQHLREFDNSRIPFMYLCLGGLLEKFSKQITPTHGGLLGKGWLPSCLCQLKSFSEKHWWLVLMTFGIANASVNAYISKVNVLQGWTNTSNSTYINILLILSGMNFYRKVILHFTHNVQPFHQLSNQNNLSWNVTTPKGIQKFKDSLSVSMPWQPPRKICKIYYPNSWRPPRQRVVSITWYGVSIFLQR